MVEHDRDRTLNGDLLDREINGLLQVDPSPEFVARVRAHIDTHVIARGWLTGRWIAVAAIAAVAVLGIAVWVGTRTMEPAARPAAVLSQHLPSAVAVQPLAEHAGIPPVTSSGPQTRVLAARVPEVVVSPRESAGLRYLLAALREGRLDSSAMPSDETAVTDMPIVIDPIIVEPLVAAADLETGAGQ